MDSTGERLAADADRAADHSDALSNAGRHPEALVATLRDVECYRALVRHRGDDPSSSETLASRLTVLAIRLGRAGEFERALVAATEAVTIRRGLVGADRATYLGGLMGSLAARASRLSALDRHAEAVEESKQSVLLSQDYLNLGTDGSSLKGSRIHNAVQGYVECLVAAGRYRQALVPAQQDVVLCEQLMTIDSARWAGDTAAARARHFAVEMMVLATGGGTGSAGIGGPFTSEPSMTSAVPPISSAQADRMVPPPHLWHSGVSQWEMLFPITVGVRLLAVVVGAGAGWFVGSWISTLSLILGIVVNAFSIGAATVVIKQFPPSPLLALLWMFAVGFGTSGACATAYWRAIHHAHGVVFSVVMALLATALGLVIALRASRAKAEEIAEEYRWQMNIDGYRDEYNSRHGIR